MGILIYKKKIDIMNGQNTEAPADGHKRTSNACGCKANWCTNICYLVIGYFFIIPVAVASVAPGIIGMWNLGPDIVASVITALAPPLTNEDFKDEVERSLVNYPPS